MPWYDDDAVLRESHEAFKELVRLGKVGVDVRPDQARLLGDRNLVTREMLKSPEGYRRAIKEGVGIGLNASGEVNPADLPSIFARIEKP